MPTRRRAGEMGRSRQANRVYRYALTGGTAALVDLGGFALLQQLSVPIAVAGSASFAVALLVNYTLTARFVFGMQPRLQRLPFFALGALSGFCTNMGVTLGLNMLGLAPLLAKCAGIGFAFGFNYTVNALVVFRR